MGYLQCRTHIKTGDALITRKGRVIRFLTGESYNHVALFAWLAPDSLWVYEFTQKYGYRALPASAWLDERRGEMVYWGAAPPSVTDNAAKIVETVLSYRDKDRHDRWYGWLSLPVVWFSQVINRRLPVHLKVCSTFVQEVWESAGYTGFRRTADPGDIAAHCLSLTRLQGGTDE